MAADPLPACFLPLASDSYRADPRRVRPPKGATSDSGDLLRDRCYMVCDILPA